MLMTTSRRETEHEIVAQVRAAQSSPQGADELVRRYLPFIKSEAARTLRRVPVEGQDDELGIAMFAFHQAAMAYQPGRGAFLPLAAKAIRNRIIDYQRREVRHSQNLSLDHSDGEEGTALMERLDSGHDHIGHRQERSAAREELAHFAGTLERFGLALSDVADNCPRQDRTLSACQKALAFARENPELLRQVEETGKVPLNALSAGAGVERKTLERHRKYLVAILLAYTNGFEVIRGHLRQLGPGKGGR